MKTRLTLVTIVVGLLFAERLYAGDNDQLYRMELGIDGGLGYYAGDAQPHIFQDIREAYGAAFRYQFDRRWSLRAKGMAQRISGFRPDGTGFANKKEGRWTNQIVNVDVVGEFNFFPYGRIRHDRRITPITPYIALGIGVGIHSEWKKVSAYMPFIVGLKWQPVPHFTIHAAWQHNVYFADNLENVTEYNNRYDLNGGSVFNCDVTGQLVVGVAVSFLQDKNECHCKYPPLNY